MSIDEHIYDHENLGDRAVLASAIIAKMGECGFEEIENKVHGERTSANGEKVFVRAIKDRMEVRVYTSVEEHDRVGIAVRHAGTDAIRVATVYTDQDGKTRGIGKQKRVHRTGKIGAITDRLHERMRDAYRVGNHARCCGDCGAPLFTSKNGKEICAELCRKRARGEYKASESFKPARRRRKYSKYRRW